MRNCIFYLLRTFSESVTAGEFAKDVPVLTGICANEGLILAAGFHKTKKRWNLLFKVSVTC